MIGIDNSLSCTISSSNSSFSNLVNNSTFIVNSDLLVTNASSFYISPNPFNQRTTVHFNNFNNLPYNVIISDSNGKEIRKYENIINTSLTIEKENLLPGLYFLYISSNDKTHRGKMIVE